MEQLPAETRVTVLPLTVQTLLVVEARLTGSSELAVAVRLAEPTLRDMLESEPKVMICAVPTIVKLCVTGVAAA